MEPIITRFSMATRRLAAPGLAVSGVVMIVLMIVTLVDAGFRYFVGRSVYWLWPLSELLMVALAFGVMALVTGNEEHLKADIFFQRFPRTAQRLVDLIGTLAGLALFVPLTWVGFFRTLQTAEEGVYHSGASFIPLWYSVGFVTAGSFAASVVLIGNLLQICFGSYDRAATRPAEGAESEEE